MDYKQIAQEIKDANESIFLIYAFNGTGKTQLSVAYKDITKKEDDTHTGVYYNAFSEDLFVWDNDEENDNANIKLMVLPSSLNEHHTFLLTTEKDDETGELIYPIQKKLRLYNPHYTFKVNRFYIDETKDIVDEEKGIESFSFYSKGDKEQKYPIKISRGEERIFVWCFFLTLIEEIAVDSEYIFIDDPVSSLDEHNLYITADSICDIIDQNFGKKKIILTTHHIGLFAILADRLMSGEKSSRFKHSTKILSLSKEGGEPILLEKKGVFLYHLFLYKTLLNAIEKDELYLYHFALLRLLLENIASFYGIGHPSFTLSKIDIDLSKIGMKDTESVMNMIHSLSHNDRYHYMDPIPSDSEKNLLRNVVEGIKRTFDFKV